MKKMKKRIMSLSMALVLTVTTLFSGMGMSTAKAADSSDVAIMVTPWGYGSGTLDASQTYSAKGYQYANVITGSDNSYAGARMNDVDLSMYKEVRFALKSDGSHWWELGKVDGNTFNMVAGAATEWVEIKMVDEGNGFFQVYNGGNWINHQLPLEANLNDLQMKYAAEGTLVMTEVRGVLRSDVSSSLKPIRDCVKDGSGTLVDVDKPIYEATKITQMSTSYGYSDFYDLDLSKYKKIKFYARNVNDGQAWIELKVGKEETYVPLGLGKVWTEISMTKNEDSTWNILAQGKEAVSSANINNLNEIKINFGENTYYLSELFAIKEPIVPTGSVVAVSPWAYEIGDMSNSNTYEDGGYVYATKIKGGNDQYAGASFSYIDLSIYSEFRFALKSDGANWWEVGKVEGNTFNASANNSANWVEFKFKDEGNGYFTAYVNDTKNDNLKLKLDANLNELQMKYSGDTSAILYMTEVRGTVREGALSKLEIVADNFNTYTGTTDNTEKPIYEATASTVASTSWVSNWIPMIDLPLADYKTVLFYMRKAQDEYSSYWFESKEFGSQDFGSKWVEFRMEKNQDSTWNLYRGGKIITENASISNLSEIEAIYGDGKYAFSQVFAVKEEKNEPDTPVVPEETYAKGDVNKDKAVNIIDLVVEKKAVTEFEDNGTYDIVYDLVRDNTLDATDLVKMRNIIATGEIAIATYPWAYTVANTNDSAVSEVKVYGFEHVTEIAGSNNTYYSRNMIDIDLSNFKEVRFAVKSTTNNYWEYMHKSDKSNALFSGAGNQWTIIRLVDEGDVLRLYNGKAWTANTYSKDTNLSDFIMRFATSGTLYMTELRGTLRDNAENNISIIKSCAKEGEGTVSYTDLPINEATQSTQLGCSWRNDGTLPNVDLSKYGMVKFYVKNSENKSIYLEMKKTTDNTTNWPIATEYSAAWMEVKFVLNTNQKWDIYIAGTKVASDEDISNLNEYDVSYGGTSCCFSEVFAVDKSFF